MVRYSKYGISIKSVEEADAEFIVGIRTDEKRRRFISKTDNNLVKQIQWIQSYKLRESANKEFYFIAQDEDKTSFATYRIYNFVEDRVEIGSFVSKPNYPKSNNIIKLDILIKEFVFDNLNYKKLNFEVRKENSSVVNYHKKLGAMIKDEDELNYYFILNKEDFLESKKRFTKILN